MHESMALGSDWSLHGLRHAQMEGQGWAHNTPGCVQIRFIIARCHAVRVLVRMDLAVALHEFTSQGAAPGMRWTAAACVGDLS